EPGSDHDGIVTLHASPLHTHLPEIPVEGFPTASLPEAYRNDTLHGPLVAASPKAASSINHDCPGIALLSACFR
ncbi:hypothetical protein, partial [Parvibaculum sp.]|uniref:hypothetical protein n=1 Tax=Parvibaculum sp. TaxID=2024848 RepID=UPI003C708213